MNYKKTAVATFVGIALTTTALGAIAGSNDNVSKSFKSLANVLAAKKLAKSSVATASGMQNQYDAKLGTTTFQWAGKKVATPDLGAIASKHKVAFAADFYLKQLTGLSSTKTGVSNVLLANVHDLGRGAMIAKYKQEVAGVEVFNREYNVMMDRNFNLVASSGYFADKKVTRRLPAAIKDMAAAFGDASQAITSAYSSIGGNSDSIQLVAGNSIDKYEKFSVTNSDTTRQLIGEPRAKRVFFEHKGQLVAAHYVEIETSADDSVDSDYFSYVVSAKTGEILFKNNLTSHADFNYRYYADEGGRPWDGPHGNVIPAPEGADPNAWQTAEYLAAPMITLSHGPISTMDPWLADDATMTKGNNVFAYVDVVSPQGFSNGDFTAETTSSYTFDYMYSIAEAEYSVNNRKAAIVNLFLVNNFLHDDYYDHGFDEASGNAQESNYGRGGEEGDSLNLEVQDNSGFNNANMSTPADGSSPRMQMYLWDKAFAENGEHWGITVTSHSDIGLLESTIGSTFGPSEFEAFAGKLVRIDDGDSADGTINDGCEAAVNAADLTGNIAVIDRGACTFVLKVRNAQNAGAIAVIVANNRDGDSAISMAGSDYEDIIIPNMMISENEGALLYSELADGDVTVSMFSTDISRSFKDSSWDNGTIAHEWGHYISNRLVGNSSGLISKQARSMGEGFGDFHALMLMSEADDALMVGNELFRLGYSDSPYIRSFVTGIRKYPYSTDMEVNPSTFADVKENPAVHASGAVWGVMLWDSYVDMINDDRHTFAEAKSLMKDYLVAGYKMMPMAPTFTEARDAILAAAYANDIEDYKVILAAFARRGMGLGATSPERFAEDHAGVVESYSTDLDNFTVASHTLNLDYDGAESGYCSQDGILDKGETGTVSFTVHNGSNSTLSALTAKVAVTSGHDVTFENDGVITFNDMEIFGSATSAPIQFTLNDAGIGDELVMELTYPDLAEEIQTGEYSLSSLVNMDFELLTREGTSQSTDMDSQATLHDFTEQVMVGTGLAEGTFGLESWPETGLYVYAPNHGFTTDVAFETKIMTVGFDGDFTIEWWHYYDLEAQYDGAVVEVSINGGEWADVTDVGGTFEGDGYIDTMYDDTEAAIADREAFTGFNQGWETVNFGENLNGNQVQFRFRISTDSGANEDGWYIDDMTFSNIETSIFSTLVAGDSFACDNHIPVVSVGADQTVNEGDSVTLSVQATDKNNDDLTYSWEQTAGTSVTLTDADTATASFTAMALSSGSEELAFTVTVSDGIAMVSNSVKVTVNNVVPPAQPVERTSNGGGSTGLLALLLLPLAIFRRRK